MDNAIHNQHTIKTPTHVEGVGYWSGLHNRVEFHPASPGDGLYFVRLDLDGHPRVPAALPFRIDTPRRSDLQCDGACVEMVEHVMAALGGLGIDNCEIRVTRSEMPGLDGSAAPFVDALRRAGRVEQPLARETRIVESVLRVGDDQCWIEAAPSPDGRTWLDYRLDYGDDNPIGTQRATLRLTPDRFAREVGTARTFLLKAEAEWLQRRGLGTRIAPRDLLVFDERGPIDNTLRFENECARHKLLDMVGDLTLARCVIVGRITAHRSGHHLNAELVRAVLAATEHQAPRKARAGECANESSHARGFPATA